MRHFFNRGGHGGGSAVFRRWSQPISPSEIPDELVEQAMAVLQGKSRDVIIKELQRTVSGSYGVFVDVCLRVMVWMCVWVVVWVCVQVVVWMCVQVVVWVCVRVVVWMGGWVFVYCMGVYRGNPVTTSSRTAENSE